MKITPTFTEEIERKKIFLENNPIYFGENLSDKHLKYNPIFIQIKFTLLYGSYEIETVTSDYYIINKYNINMMENIIFNNEKLIISHLPRETRLGITLLILNKELKNPFEIGSCQLTLFDEDGNFNEGEIKLNIWPFFKIEPRINCCDNFYRIKNNNEILKNKEINKNLDSNIINNYSISENIDINKKILNNNIKNKNKNLNKKDIEIKENYPIFKEKKINKEDYCVIILKFPKFSKPLSFIEKDPISYKNFLKIKNSGDEEIKKEFDELFGNLLNEMDQILNDVKESDKDNNKNDKIQIKYNLSNEENSPLNLEQFDKNLLNISNLINRDPLTPLSEKERKQILLCRDYLSTLPSALEIFLRSINWFNPLQSYLAHLYIKRWAPLQVEDAIGLLDCRFPDLLIRELAINTLNKTSDENIELYMMQLCQCLFYENYLINPLADFLIEKSLSNQKLLGNKFYWTAKVGMENYLFRDRLSIILAHIFMLSGPTFIDDIEFKLKINNKFKSISNYAKNLYAIKPR